jgi:hypothetical protein
MSILRISAKMISGCPIEANRYSAGYDKPMTSDSGVPSQDGSRGFVVSSEVTISPESAEILQRSFRERLHLVEKAPGSSGLRPDGVNIHPVYGE